MPKILITGANGFLGEHLIQLLKHVKHWEIIATARGENKLKNKEGYRFLSLDICDKNKVGQVIKEEKPNYVIHAAAMTQVDQCEINKNQCWETNVEGTRYLLEATKEIEAFFIFISTDFIFDGKEGPYKEEAVPHPVNFYGESKWSAEKLLQEASIPSVILRTVLVYGSSDDKNRSNIVRWLKSSLKEKKAIKVVDDQWRTPTLVQDLAEGCRLVMVKKEEGKSLAPVYNISGKELLTPYQMALKVADFYDLDKRLITRADATTFQQKAQRPAKTGFVLDRAEKELDYHPHTFEEGLELMSK